MQINHCDPAIDNATLCQRSKETKRRNDNLNSTIARVIIHPGANDDGYWKNEHVVAQLRDTVIPIFNILHPPDMYQGVFCFDNSRNHGYYAPDALIASNLNVSDGGSRCNGKVMRQGKFGDSVQNMQTPEGKQKGLRTILQERGINTEQMLKADMIAVLNSHPDFANQKPWLQEICYEASHLIIFFPKFHPELNWIERYWSIAKAYARANCDYTFETLKSTVPQALDHVGVQTMRRYARKCFRYECLSCQQ